MTMPITLYCPLWYANCMVIKKTTAPLAKLLFPELKLQTNLDLLTFAGCLEGELNEKQ